MNILCGRAQLIGDQVASLPIAGYFKRRYPNAKTIFPVAKKVSQVAPLYLMHPDIDQIYIFDGQEGPESKGDFNMIKSCDIIINPNPPHPDNRYPLEFNIYSESWRMAGLPIEEWNKLTEFERRPRLVKWFKPEPRLYEEAQKTVALWGFASYGNREPKRNPTVGWYEDLIELLHKSKIKVVRFGHPNDPDPANLYPEDSHTSLDFFTQIKMTLSTDLMLGTDSGSSLIIAGYEFPQVTLLTDHWGNTHNPLALAPNNPNNFNIFAPNGCNNIKVKEVFEKILEKLNGN